MGEAKRRAKIERTLPPDEPSPTERLMERAGQPGPVVAIVLIAAIIVLGWRAPQYLADPTSVPGQWRGVVGSGLGLVVYMSFVTLNVAAYCLIAARNSAVSRQFVAAVGNRAAIGAILGTLLGLRMAVMMRPAAGRAPVSFLGFEGNLSNTITLVTLVLIATTWFYCWGPALELARFRRAPGAPERPPGRANQVFAALLLTGSNYLGLQLGWTVFRAVMHQ